MSIASIGANALSPLFSAGRATAAGEELLFAQEKDKAAKSADSLTILPPSSATPLSFDTILALQSEPIPTLTEAKVEEKSAADLFLEEARKNPIERMREQVMEELGLSEDALAQMAPEERRAAEDKIRQMIEEKFRQAMGGDEALGSNAEALSTFA